MSLNVFLLGQFQLMDGDRPLALTSRPAQSLFAYLAMTAGMRHRRERLAGLLWPEATESNARGYLRQALWRIRKALDDGSLSSDDFLHVTDVNVAFKATADYWLDADCLRQTTETMPVNQLLQTADLYRGELLPGFYDEWIPPERDRMLVAYQQTMRLLLENLLREARWQEALRWGERWLQNAHAPEQAFRSLMRAYAGLDDQRMVRTTYQRCCDALTEELGLEPSLETKQLVEALRRGETAVVIPPQEEQDSQASHRPAFLDAERIVVIEQPLFVARDQELAKLDQFLAGAVQGNGQVGFITGEAGSGKTALMTEFARRAAATYAPLIVAGGNCSVHTGIGDPYFPFREILEMLTGDVEGRWTAGVVASEQARKLWRLAPEAAEAVARRGPELVDSFIHGAALIERLSAQQIPKYELINQLQSLTGQRPDMVVSTVAQQNDYFEQYSRVLRALAQERPMLLLIDDLQWADLGSISLLFHFGRQIAGVPILILGAYRPEEIALGRDGSRHSLETVVNELGRLFGDNRVNLNEAKGREFVDSILDSEPNQLGPSFRHLVVNQTRGNPLFTIELLHGMQERGDLAKNEQGQWIEAAALDWENLPARVEAVIAERIGRLDPELLAVLHTASVEGDVFTAEIVARVLGRDEREIVTLLSNELERKHRLVRARSIVRRGGVLLSSYRFRHSLFQQYLYHNQSEIERVRLHEHVGTILEEIYGKQEDIVSIAPQLALHFMEAQVTDRAIKYLYQAAKNAVMLCAYDGGIDHLRKGMALLETLPQGAERDHYELELQLVLALALQGTEGTAAPSVRAAWARARELSAKTGEAWRYSMTLGGLSTTYFVRAELSEGMELAEEVLNLAIENGDPLMVAIGNWYTGFFHFTRGDFSLARDSFAETIAFYDPREHHELFVSVRGTDIGQSGLAYQACCHWLLGYVDQARVLSDRALRLAKEADHPFSLEEVLSYGACMFHRLRRDSRSQLKYAEEFRLLIDQRAAGEWRGNAKAYHGDALAQTGRLSEGIAVIKEAVDYNETINTQVCMTVYLGFLARAQAENGNFEESWAALNKAFAKAEKSGEWFWATELYLVKADLLLNERKPKAAMEALHQAVDIAHSQEALSWELRAAMDLARLYIKQGESEPARTLLKPVYDSFTEGFDTADLRAASELLAGLPH